LRALVRRHRLLRIPVYRDTIDNIVGVISAKALFLNPTKKLESLVQPARFMPEQATCEVLLRHFRKTHSQLALVVDEYGGLAGVVAMEDVVEAIVGELRAPEERADMPLLRRIDDLTYMADANLDVHEFCRAFELPDEETRIHTLGGLVAQELDRVPMTGDEARIAHARMTVVHMRHRRVIRVRVTLDEPIPDSPELNVLLAQSGQAPRDAQPGDAS
jgi:CBS domain containing-hemolysin-like protein